ncbi:MAG: AAA family ATPase [Patescibacteria group bacterium]
MSKTESSPIYYKGTCTLKELMELPESSAPSYLVNQLIPEFGISYLYGHPGMGKTWVVLEIARAVASGDKFVGQIDVKQGNVLIIDEESGIWQMRQRCKLLGFSKNLPLNFLSQNGFKLDNPSWIDEIVQYIMDNNIKCLILDPFAAVHDCEENSSSEMQKVMTALQQLALAGCSVIFVHHSRKGIGTSGQNTRGSSAILGRADSAISIDGKTLDGINTIILQQEKNRCGPKSEPIKLFLIQNEDDKGLTLEYGGHSDKNILKVDTAKTFCLKILNEESLPRMILQERIVRESKCGVRNAGEAIRLLVSEQKIVYDTKNGKREYKLVH